MRRHFWYGHVAFACLILSQLQPTAIALGSKAKPPQATRSRPRLSTPDVAEKASPSVVTLTTPAGQGSGVIIDSSGVVVTNLHVIRAQTQVVVKLANGDTYDDVRIIDADERKDLALLKIKAFGLAVAQLGNSNQVRAGDHVVLIGSPKGLEMTVSDGLISAVRDMGEGYHLLQTSAAASPGSSGGGMFNDFGELIGITSGKLAGGDNLNFGIPVNYVRGLSTNDRALSLTEFAARFAPTGASAGSTDGAAVTPRIPVAGHSKATTGVASVLDGHVQLAYDSGYWTKKALDDSTLQFDNPTTDLHVRLVTNRIEAAEEDVPQIELANFRQLDPKAQITRSGFKTVNGVRMLLFEAEATIGGSLCSYYVHVYSDTAGTVELSGWTRKHLIDNGRGVFDELASGLTVQR
jgi:hypothetical protein